MTVNTLGSLLTSASLCRLNGWKPGTVLQGDSPVTPGAIPGRIRITAIGEDHILARAVGTGVEDEVIHEIQWPLQRRDWRRVKP